MKITLLYFAQLKEEIGLDSEVWEIASPISGQELLERIGEKYPLVRRLAASLSLAVNEEYFDRSEILPEGATVALIPPVSGG